MKYIFSIFIAIFLVACSPTDSSYKPNSNSTTNNQNPPISSAKLNDIKVFFSQSSGSYKGGVDEKIVADINASKESIYLALYELTNKKIRDALIGAYSRGVEVKVVTDDKTYSQSYNLFDDLEDAGIEVKTDKNFSHGLMHDKFMIIDNRVLWGGSGNYTLYSFYRNYENYFRVTNRELIANYKAEFEEMQNEKLRAGTYISSSYELYFSPEDNFREKRLLSLVRNSQKSLYIMAFALNDDELKDAIIDAKGRGVDIHIIFDKEQTEGYQKDYTQYKALKDAGIDTVLVGNRAHKMHNKVIIVDSKIVLTGSYNFTVSANEDNCENELIIKNSTIAQKYLDDFNEVYGEKED